MNNKSFTLIELLVVIAIIGVLAAIVITTISGAVTKSRIVRLQVFSDTIRAQLSDSLVSWWSFNEGSGTDAKDMWEGNDGTLVGDPEWKSGGECVSGSCLEFDGTGDYVDCGTGLKNAYLGDTISIELWTKVTSWSGLKTIISDRDDGDDGNLFLFYHTNQIAIDLYSGEQIRWVTGYNPPDNEWVHLTIIHNGTDTILYANSVRVAITDTQATATFPGTTQNLWIGRSYINDYYFNGLIDEVRIYNSAATITQIQSQYLAGLDKLLSNGAISKTEYNQRIKKLSKEIVIQ